MKGYYIDRDGLVHNAKTIMEYHPDLPIYGVVKGDGYGLGICEMAAALHEAGIRRFAVTEISEVKKLRDMGFAEEEILMIRSTQLPEELKELLALNAVITISGTDTAMAAEAVAAEAEGHFTVHLKVDTGMGRYGFFPGEETAMEEVFSLPHLTVGGIYTHFHSAFCSDEATRAQFSAFTGVTEKLIADGFDPGVRHCCNSSAYLKFPEMHLDAARVGSAMLGRLGLPKDYGLRRLGICRCRVEEIREIPKGHSVGYGAGFVAKRPTKIAVCGVGYFHGFSVERGNDLFRFRDCVRGGLGYVKAWLKKKAIYGTINGKPAKALGHIGMVQTIFDVTDIPCAVGDPIEIEINPLLVKGLDRIWTRDAE